MKRIFARGPAAETGGTKALRTALLAWAVAAVVLWVVITKVSPLSTPAKWDEFILTYDAQRILGGQVPYAGFFQFIPPGSLLLLAGWFKLCGGTASLTAGRYLAAVTALATWLLLGRFMRKASWPSAWSHVGAALFPVALYTFWAVPSHHWFADLLFLASFAAWDFVAGRVRGVGGWFWLGASLALTMLDLQTAAIVLAALWGTVWALEGVGRGRKALWASAGALLVVLPSLAWLWARGAAPAFFRDVVLWTARHYRAEGGVNAVGLVADLPDRLVSLWAPAGGAGGWMLLSLGGTLCYVGVFAAGLLALARTVGTVTACARGRRWASPLAAGACLATVAEGTLFLMGKTDWLHLVFALGRVGPLWLLLGPVGLPGKWSAAAVRWCAGMLLVSAALFHGGGILMRPAARWEFTDVDRPTREAPANRWLRAQPWVLPGDTVAAFPEGGEVYLYTRPAAVGYTLLYPPADRYHAASDYAAVAKQLDERKPRCILIATDRERDYFTPPTPLSQRLVRDYVRLGTVGGAAAYRRREAP